MLLMTLLPDVQPVRALVQVLSWQAEMQLEANQPELAATTIIAMLQVNHVFDHDPFSICMIVRAALAKKSCQATQRLLAQSSTTTSATLLRLQQAFAREESSMISLPEIYRWERAAYDHELRHFHLGEYSLSEYLQKFRNSFVAGKSITGYAALDRFLLWFSPGFQLEAWAKPRHYALERAELLQHYQHVIAWSQLPEHELMDKLEACLAIDPVLSPFCFKIFTGMSGDWKAYQTAKFNHVRRLALVYLLNHAHCRCIIASLAVERYRMHHGTWPASWEQLTPTFLPAVPLDPFTGKPLVLKRLSDGLVIYSLGINRTDEGGKIFPFELQHDNDIGYRLWNPAQRRVETTQELKDLKAIISSEGP